MERDETRREFYHCQHGPRIDLDITSSSKPDWASKEQGFLGFVSNCNLAYLRSKQSLDSGRQIHL